MNSWTIFALIVGVVHLAGLLALICCAKWAPEGYEDEDGFHLASTSAAPSTFSGGDPAEQEWKHAA